MKTTGNKLITVRIILAFLAAICLVMNRSWNRIGEALHLPRFYLALALSFAIAYVILSIIHISNRMLDQRFSWRPNPDKPAWRQSAFYVRALLQFSFCLLVPAGIDLLVIGIYIEAIGRDFWTSGFLYLDFPLVVILMAILNGIYIIYPVTRKQTNRVNNDDEGVIPEGHTLSVGHNNIHVNLRLPEDVLCFIKNGRYVDVLSTHGSKYTHNETLSVIEELYAADNFVRINRAVIVNMACIKGYQGSQTPKNIDVIFKPIYQEYINDLNGTLLIVSRDRVAHFKEVFNRNQDKLISLPDPVQDLI